MDVFSYAQKNDNPRKSDKYDYTQFVTAMQSIPYIGKPVLGRERNIEVLRALVDSMEKLPSTLCKEKNNDWDILQDLSGLYRIWTGIENAYYLQKIMLWDGKSENPSIVLAIHNSEYSIENNKDDTFELIYFATDQSGLNITNITWENFFLRQVNKGTLRKPKFEWAVAEKIGTANCFQSN